MDSAPPATNIDDLSNEILLQIFNCDLSPSTLSAYMLTSRRWANLASTVLYRHVVLTTHALTRWIASSPPSRDSGIESLTLRIDGVGSGPGSEATIAAMEQLRSDLTFLPSRLTNMKGLRSFSFRTPKSLPTGMWIPGPLLMATISQLPASCSSLEVDIWKTHDASDAAPATCHLCPSIRGVLPQLQYMCLGLPKLCPEAFGQVSDLGSSYFDPVKSPRLEQCVIKVSVPSVPASVVRTQGCGQPDSNIVVILADCLRALSSSQNTQKLQQLLIMDALPLEDQFTSFPSLVRRDVVAGKSLALPYKNIGGRKSRGEGVLIRIPTGEDTEKSADVVTSMDGVKALAEGHAWTEATTRSRLPSRVISKTSLIPALFVERTADEWLRETKTSCLLWANENILKTKTLFVKEGDLTEDCTPHIRLPEGWLINGGGMLEAINA